MNQAPQQQFTGGFQQGQQQGGQDPNRSVYVGNIAWRTTEQEIGDTFANFGYVSSVKIITDKETGRSKGFGFVEFQDNSLLQTVIQQMNGYNLNGRQLRVNAANGGQNRQMQQNNFNNMQNQPNQMAPGQMAPQINQMQPGMSQQMANPAGISQPGMPAFNMNAGGF